MQPQQQTQIENKKPENIELISEQKWDRIKLPINTSVIRIQMLSVFIFLILLLIPISIVIYTFLATPYSFIAGGFIAIIYLFMFIFIFLSYMQNTSFEYEAVSGKLYKVENNITGTIFGKIIVRRGYFNKNEKNLPMNEFERVTVRQSLLGRWLNYGTIRLEQVNTLENTQAINLRYVKNPSEVGKMIQGMVDLAKQKTMAPQPPNPPVGF